MQIGIGLGLGMRRAGSAIAAYLGRQSRYADWRPVLPYLWQTDDTSSAVTADGQTAGRMSAQQGSAADMLWTQATSDARPTWRTTYMDADGGDTFVAAGQTAGLLNGAAQVCFAGRLRIDAIGAVQQFLGLSSGTAAGASRLMVGADATGKLQVQVRRLDADSATTATSAAAAFTAATNHSLIVTVDIFAGGSGAIKGYVDGTEVLSASLASTGAASATDSLRGRLLGNLANTAADRLDGRLYRCIVAAGTSAIPTAAERAAIFAELAS